MSHYTPDDPKKWCRSEDAFALDPFCYCEGRVLLPEAISAPISVIARRVPSAGWGIHLCLSAQSYRRKGKYERCVILNLPSQCLVNLF
jgi:hypothetical protein